MTSMTKTKDDPYGFKTFLFFSNRDAKVSENEYKDVVKNDKKLSKKLF